MNGGDDDVMTLSEGRVLLLSDVKEEEAAVGGRTKELRPR